MKVNSLMYASGNKHCKTLPSQNKLPYLACRSEPSIFPKTNFAFRVACTDPTKSLRSEAK